jgi:general secretion pathway protein K
MVATLWMLTALAVLASVYSIYIANTASFVAVNDENIRAEALTLASLELAAYRVMAAPAKTRSSRGQFGFYMNGANVEVEFCSEAARVDLNKASREFLSGLFTALGSDPVDAERYTDRIIGWRSPPPFGALDNEETLYRAAGLAYGPRGAPFAHVGELALVLGIPAAVAERAISFVTVYNGRSGINIYDAAPEVIAALPAMTAERVKSVLSDRQSLMKQPVPAEVTTENSKAIRVTVGMAFDSGRRMMSEAVILVDGHDEPYRVLSWQGNSDVQPMRGGS